MKKGLKLFTLKFVFWYKYYRGVWYAILDNLGMQFCLSINEGNNSEMSLKLAWIYLFSNVMVMIN